MSMPYRIALLHISGQCCTHRTMPVNFWQLLTTPRLWRAMWLIWEDWARCWSETVWNYVYSSNMLKVFSDASEVSTRKKHCNKKHVCTCAPGRTWNIWGRDFWEYQKPWEADDCVQERRGNNLPVRANQALYTDLFGSFQELIWGILMDFVGWERVCKSVPSPFSEDTSSTCWIKLAQAQALNSCTTCSCGWKAVWKMACYTHFPQCKENQAPRNTGSEELSCFLKRFACWRPPIFALALVP